MSESSQASEGLFVRYEQDPSDDQVRFFHTADPRGVLTVGEVYEVERREVHSWHIRLFLAGVPSGVGFNDVTFESAADPSSVSL